jgi:hypothetical protein
MRGSIACAPLEPRQFTTITEDFLRRAACRRTDGQQLSKQLKCSCHPYAAQKAWRVENSLLGARRMVVSLILVGTALLMAGFAAFALHRNELNFRAEI